MAEKPALAKDFREEAVDRKSTQTESLTAEDEAKKQSPAGEPDADKLTTRARSLLDSVTNGARSDAVPLPIA